MPKLKIGILGIGRVSASHIRAIKDNSRLMELVAVADPSEPKTAEAVRATGAWGFARLEDMLSHSKLDAVAICTPNGLHYEQARAVLMAGVNVIVEKPLTLDYKQGEELIKLARRKKRRVFLIHQNRFNPTIQCVRRALDEGAFGNIYLMQANVFWHRDKSYYAASPWHGSKLVDGGAFITQASHYSDLMHWFANDELKRVYAVGNALEHEIETEDTGAATIEWRGGVIGSMGMSVLAYDSDYEGSLTILGQNGLARVGGVALNKIQDWKFSRPVKDFCDTSYKVDSVYGRGHTPYYKSVAAALLEGKDFLISDADALGSLKLILSIAESIETGEVVRF